MRPAVAPTAVSGEAPTRRDLESPLISPETKSNGAEKLCIDEMLKKYCGEFGWWQMKHFTLTSLAWTLEAFHTMVMIFADREPKWACTGPGCKGPIGPGQGSTCEMEGSTWEWVSGKGSSTVAEWGLVCGEKYKVGLVQALFFVGTMIGAGVFGHLSDSKLGRKGTLIVVCILNAIFGLLTALSPNYFIYAVLRTLTGFSSGGVGLCTFVLSTEPIGPTKRGVAAMYTFYFFSSGIALLSGIAYIFQTWRLLYVASSLPSVLFVVFVIPFISESPRWYLVRGRIREAMEVMQSIANVNGKQLPPEVEIALDDENGNNNAADKINNAGSIIEARLEGTEVQGSLIDVLRSPVTRVRLILAVGINFACSVVYYGLSLNVVNLKTNLYLNVLVNAVAEMPPLVLTGIMIDVFGRKPLTIGTIWFSGYCCLIGSFMRGPGTWKILRMLFAVLGIFGIAGTYNLLFIYTAELFPTVVRNAALGCATQAAQIGAILAPIIVVMGGMWPLLVFGICGIVGGVLVFYLPETLNRPFYDTMEGMEHGEAARSQ